ncbi:MAG TPA: YwiC-like family protein [Thermoanaerobaculia bacterium]|nr:YwiC-like family protein [Thermoanaerobaculia bacterium]
MRTGRDPKARPLWRSVVLPPEHGSWGLVAEPLVLGLAVSPSWAGLVLALGVLSAFLAYRPAKLFYGDSKRGRKFHRTRMALAFTSILALVSAVLFAASVGIAGARPLLAFLAAAPFALVFVAYDLAPGRFWQAEAAAPVAFASSAAAVALAGSASWRLAAALCVIVVARALPSVLYVRARLRLERGEPARRRLALVAQALGLIAVSWMSVAGWLPRLAVLAMALLLLRASLGLSPWRHKASARAVGLSEVGWGALTVLIVAAGFWTQV